MIELLSWSCFLTGGFLCITGGVGLLRFPDFYTRVHAAGVTETLAAPLLLGGLILQLDWSLDTVKVLLIIVFVLATNPTASHAMAKAALHGGHLPEAGEKERPHIPARASKA
jgi:multicomponent Na+:H+ antiporter subunit G